MPITALAVLLVSQAPCPAGAEPIPTALSAWRPGAAVTAGASVEAAPALAIGAPAEIALRPAAGLDLAVLSDRTVEAGAHGGMIAFTVERAGTYRIALSTPGWIEVFASGKRFVSTGHGHGPRCSGMRKIVDFTLAPGQYILQVTANPVASTRAMIVPAG